MIDEYISAQKQGKRVYELKTAAGEFPYLPALDGIAPGADTFVHQSLGLMEIPVDLIVGTKTQLRQNSFAPGFMPLLEGDSEFALKWSNLYKSQINEGFRDPIKVYEYLHHFYVQEGNKRVSVSKVLGIPSIMADVTRLVPPSGVLKENPVYSEFLKFYNVSHIYDIECSWAGAYIELAELMGMDLDHTWPEEVSRSLRSSYWSFSVVYKELAGKLPDLLIGDAFAVYLRIYIRDALRDQPKDIVSKRVLRIQKEFLTEKNTDRVELVESSAEALEAGSLITRTGNIVSKVFQTLSYTTKHPLKAAFMYDNMIVDSRWTADHEKGRQRLESTYEGMVETRYFEGCKDQTSFEAALYNAVEWGADVLFTTSPSMINNALRAAIEYNNIKVLNCSVNLAHQAVRTYYVRMYEAKFLAGLIAGTAAASDGTHCIGYRSDYPIYGTIAGINAFAVGAAMADPLVRIYLEWKSRQGVNWWWDMVDKGIHVISALDSIHSADGSDAYGLCYVERCAPGEGNDLSGTCRIKNLAVPIYKWGRMYESIIKTVMDGIYYAEPVDRKDQATNYWWGMDSGVVDIVLSESLPSYTKQLVNALKRDITDGRFNPFDGELRSQEGLVRSESDPPLTSRDIIMMDWLNENIIGEIPAFDSLKDEAQATVRYSGVGKTKRETMT